jgi:hypothetical protein
LKLDFVEGPAGLEWAWADVVDVYLRLGIVAGGVLKRLRRCNWD